MSTRDAIIGASVSAITAETPMAIVIVTANSRNSRPTMPPMNSSGMNTATRLTEIETTVNAISFVPVTAADRGFSPFSIWRTMFSRTTIASSTTNPVASVSASRLRLSRLKPARYMPANVPIAATGRMIAGMIVAARVAEHEEDDEDDEERGPDERRLRVGDRVADRLRPVDDDVEVRVRRQALADLGEQRLDPVGHRDDVRAGLALDSHRDARPPVELRRAAQIVERIDGRRDVADANRQAVLVRDDDVGEVARLRHRARRIEDIVLAAVTD